MFDDQAAVSTSQAASTESATVYNYDTPFEVWAGSQGIVNKIPDRSSSLATSWSVNSKYGQRINDAMMISEREFVRDLLEQVKQVPGAVCEFGVFEGEWLKILSDSCQQINPDRRVYGFDSFEGLPAPQKGLDIPGFHEGEYAATFDEVYKRLDCGRSNVTLVKGWFSETLNGQEAQNIKEVAYARIDCDLYEPALECLRFLKDRLCEGAVLVFDDWSWWSGHGEARAFFEWAPTSGLQFEFLAYNSWIHLYLRVAKRTTAL